MVPNTITGGGSSLTLRNNTFTLDGDLTNQGNLGVLSNVTLNGPGEILSTGLLALGGTLNTVARVSGGVATNFGSLQIGVSGLVAKRGDEDLGPLHPRMIPICVLRTTDIPSSSPAWVGGSK